MSKTTNLAGLLSLAIIALLVTLGGTVSAAEWQCQSRIALNPLVAPNNTNYARIDQIPRDPRFPMPNPYDDKNGRPSCSSLLIRYGMAIQKTETPIQQSDIQYGPECDHTFGPYPLSCCYENTSDIFGVYVGHPNDTIQSNGWICYYE